MSSDTCTTQDCCSNDSEQQTPRNIVCPPADVIERDGAFLVTVDMPGAMPGHIDIGYERSLLTIETPTRPDGNNESVYRKTMRFEDSIDADRIEADYRDGVLSLRLPKREPTHIKV